MEKITLQTPNLTARNIDKIAELFPNCITETKDENGTLKKAVKFDILKQMLSEDVIEGSEAYEFTWVGKKAATVEAFKSINKTLRPCPEESVDWDNTQNLYIEGDNLEVLKLLQESYLKKVKMIYIDPPYNTGNDFIYMDDFRMSEEEWEELSDEYDEEGNRLYRNTESNGRFHSDWCSMIYSRLLLARGLLTDDGVIFISIDDHEVDNLKKICDEVFGSDNFIAQLVWKKKYTGGKGTKTFADYHEYILSYAKNFSMLGEISMARPENEKEKFTQEDEYLSERGRYYTRPLKSNLDPRPTLVYPIKLPNGKSVKTQWICAKETYEKLLSEGRIEFKNPKTSQYPVYKKFYEKDDGGNVKIPSFLEISNNNEAKEELKEIFGITQTRDLPFQTPKPIKLLGLFVENFTSSNDIVLDFFSGSATTAHAVMQLNAEDGGNRQFIMVQIPEECNEKSEAYKAGYKNICEIGKERIRRAGAKIKESMTQSDSLFPSYAPALDTGFRVFKVADSNMNDVERVPRELTQKALPEFAENIKAERTGLDLLFGCALDWGLSLSMLYSSEQVDGYTVHTYTEGDTIDLMACFDEKIPQSVFKFIAKQKPNRVVFRDSCFIDSPSKINAETLIKTLSPDTEIKVI